jgi:hypothetical protein
MLRYEYSCPINSKQPVQVCRAERLIQPAYLHRSANQLDCDPSRMVREYIIFTESWEAFLRSVRRGSSHPQSE